MSRDHRRAEEISALTEMTVLKQMQRGASMAAYQPPRSKFMINDILGGNGKLKSSEGSEDRTPSPQPRDLSVFLHSLPDNDDDSDCDSSKFIFYNLFTVGRFCSILKAPLSSPSTKSLRKLNGNDL